MIPFYIKYYLQNIPSLLVTNSKTFLNIMNQHRLVFKIILQFSISVLTPLFDMTTNDLKLASGIFHSLAMWQVKFKCCFVSCIRLNHNYKKQQQQLKCPCKTMNNKKQKQK